MKQGEEGLIRTLLAIHPEDGSMTFAGNIPQGTNVQLMHADYDQIVEGARDASRECFKKKEKDFDFALLISCVGRKLLLGNNIDLEVESINQVFEKKVAMTGFYSYGEIGPFKGSGLCELHNQTMTITTFTEKP
jgi:hypothetical protein